MKKIFCFLFIITLCLTVIGCQESTKKNADDPTDQQNKDEVMNGNEGKDMNGIDIYDFAFIKMAPKSKGKHSLNEVIKIYFTEGGFSSGNTIAIDVANNILYKNPSMDSQGLSTNDGTIKLNDSENVINILEKHNIQEWKHNYTFEDPGSYQDGYSWMLRLQYEDGTVEEYHGEGTRKNKIIPKNFEEFAAELNSFVNERLEEK